MARRKHDHAVEVRVEALEAAGPETLANRLVLWSAIAAFAALMLSWIGAVQA